MTFCDLWIHFLGFKTTEFCLLLDVNSKFWQLRPTHSTGVRVDVVNKFPQWTSWATKKVQSLFFANPWRLSVSYGGGQTATRWRTYRGCCTSSQVFVIFVASKHDAMLESCVLNQRLIPLYRLQWFLPYNLQFFGVNLESHSQFLP